MGSGSGIQLNFMLEISWKDVMEQDRSVSPVHNREDIFQVPPVGWSLVPAVLATPHIPKDGYNLPLRPNIMVAGNMHSSSARHFLAVQNLGCDCISRLLL